MAQDSNRGSKPQARRRSARPMSEITSRLVTDALLIIFMVTARCTVGVDFKAAAEVELQTEATGTPRSRSTSPSISGHLLRTPSLDSCQAQPSVMPATSQVWVADKPAYGNRACWSVEAACLSP